MSRFDPPSPRGASHRRRYTDQSFGVNNIYNDDVHYPGRSTEPARRPRDSEKEEKLRHVQRVGNRTRLITQSRPHGPEAVPQQSLYYDRNYEREPIAITSRSNAVGYAYPEIIIQNNPEAIFDQFGSDVESPMSEAGSEISFTFDLDSIGHSFIADEDGSFQDEKPKAYVPRKLEPRKDLGTYEETIHSVIYSKYLGDDQARGSISADLRTQSEAPAHSSTDSNLLMRWTHLESQCPGFEYFSDHVQRLPGLDEDYKQDIAALLERTREAHEQSILTSDGPRGKYLEACLDEEVILNKHEKKNKAHTIRFLCLPYFFLAPYSGYTLPNTSSLHPMKTLLQYSSASTSKKRDLDQAVCRLEYTKKGNCYHVPQIWCLILDNDILLTCSRLSSTDLRSGIIDIVSTPPVSGGDKKPAYVRVSDGANRLWILPKNACTPWFRFVANFKDTSSIQDFENDFEVRHKGRVVDTTSWVQLFSQTYNQSIKLTIRKRMSNRNRNYDLASDESEPEDTLTASVVSQKPVQIYDNDDKGVDAVTDNTMGSNKNLEIVEAPIDTFYYFLWLTSVKPQMTENNDFGPGTSQGKFSVDLGNLSKLIRSMQAFLHASKAKTRIAVQRCPINSLREVEESLLRTPQTSTNDGKNKSRNPHRPAREEEGIAKPVRSSESFHRRRGSPPAVRSRQRDTDRRPFRSRSRDEEVIVSEYADTAEAGGRPRRETFRYVPSRDVPISTTRLSKQKAQFVTTAKTWFQFYFPLCYSSHLISKYWGAVKSLIEDDAKFTAFYEGANYSPSHNNITQRLVSISSILSNGKGPLPWNIQLPEEFGKAWIHILMYLIYSSSENTKYRSIAEVELRRGDELLAKGRRALLRNATQIPLSEREAVLPLGIVSLIAKKLLQDITNGQPDITSSYYEYFKQLEQEVQSNPYDRSHQEKLACLRQEIDIILKVFSEQLECITDLQSKTGQGGALESEVHFPKEREFYILHRCMFSLNARIQSFQEIGALAIDLGQFNIRRIEGNKDRQEAAILVFTIVTIIFLPLSFVSSFLGMNTRDVRDMGSTQWIFWASAIPITIIIVGLSMLFAQRVEPTRQWFNRLMGGSGGKASGNAAVMVLDGPSPQQIYGVQATEYGRLGRRTYAVPERARYGYERDDDDYYGIRRRRTETGGDIY
ncbi:hypothetical protein BP5796_09143 [Coleophoma crateriformis]|uniref:Uncharacterized protein n=1 Tax=Coleophoma crateriformis TaxID=565419 RepID=A0A3D8R3C8_9HELO|nr:hypothetical protein BP5796_09143 [Coleophoma crateriformis]